LNLRSCVIPLLCLSFLGSILQATAFPNDQVTTIIGGIRSRYGSALGLTAMYTREAISKTMVTLGVAERHDVAKGTLYFKPPYCLRLEQASPQEELLITDGQTLWWYIPGKKEAYQYAAETFGKELRLLGEVLHGLKGARDNFKITYKDNPEASTYQLVLRPEPPWKDIDHLELIIGKGDFIITQVDIFNTIGGLTRFMLSDLWEDVSLREGLFSFSAPPGTKVTIK
jgi:outer membrane lipoprotein-sorting protein